MWRAMRANDLLWCPMRANDLCTLLNPNAPLPLRTGRSPAQLLAQGSHKTIAKI
jgi:hypothetical protein